MKNQICFRGFFNIVSVKKETVFNFLNFYKEKGIDDIVHQRKVF